MKVPKIGKGNVLTVEEVRSLPRGSVVMAVPTGLVMQKHDTNCWYQANDWEGAVSDAHVGKVVLVGKAPLNF